MMPPELRGAIDEEVAKVDPRALARAAADITESYKEGRFAIALASQAHRAAYLAVRMPATYAALEHVFAHSPDALSGCETLLDLGAGPGTAMWAATAWGDPRNATCVERDPHLIEAGRRLAAKSRLDALRSATWAQADIARPLDVSEHDVVVVSYALGELKDASALIASAWRLARRALVVLEPGTPRNFGLIHAARQQLLEAGAFLAAPCPHHEACPMFATSDWCHFAARLERTSMHRRIKGGALGYEDEKFSYVVAVRTPAERPASRILRHPLVHPGHMKFTLCRPEVPELRTVTKSQKDIYRPAKRLGWGDGWDF